MGTLIALPALPAVTTFDRLFEEGAPLVRHHLHHRESPPVEGGRWPVSVVLRPDPVSAGRLERTMTEAEAYAGPGHFRTGTADSAHFTIRALERYRQTVDDEAVRRYAGALRRAARDVGPIALDLGRAVTDTAELVRFRYEDGPAGRLMRPEVLASAGTGLENGFADIEG